MVDSKQPKDFAITITEDPADNTYDEKLPPPAKPSQQEHASRNVLPRLSTFIHEWTPFLLVASYFVFSTCIYMVCNEKLIGIFWFIYLATNFYIAGSTVLEAFMSITPCEEAKKAVEKLQNNNWIFPTPDEKLPILDLLIVAYLPNEEDIIMDRVFYALERIVYPKEKIRTNVLYNTPKPIEPLETELRNLTYKYSQLRVIKVPNSSSKADNLNYYFTLETGADLIAIFDCDHYPHPHGPRWAAERFCQDASVDIVQGRCIVFNASASFLAGMISVEFDKIYAVSHPGRAAMWGFGLFCGSNGYWRATLLRDLKMDGDMLTEDIDSALRAVSRGANTVHELNAVSYELAPTALPTFWKQRLRWAQGWAQASMKHLKLSYQKSPEGYNRNFTVRFGLFSLLLIREWSYYLVTQYTCLVASFMITKFPKTPFELARLVYFQYPVSQWLFIIRSVGFNAYLEAPADSVSTALYAYSLRFGSQLESGPSS
ncbi:hypothetical protein H2199_003213 [Coniosporium tulheliwenetii]|uniref:Uncharacterized protein n=1 Tax=Coniosporium tulheliwenetii TaxID=3383036 RepID=A0ACC2ZBQ4_9PEZI|nr:hypothetical protein H2199_003213 [Cladosporium sp. JES 115]